MDPRVIALATRAPSGPSREDALLESRRRRASHARARRAELAPEVVDATIPKAKLETTLACVPGAAEMLGVRCKRSSPIARAEALIRTALSVQFRGSGPALERCRQLQRAGQAMLSKFAQEKQVVGLEIWKSCPRKALIRGVVALWDEAAQWVRGLYELSSDISPATQQKVLI